MWGNSECRQQKPGKKQKNGTTARRLQPCFCSCNCSCVQFKCVCFSINRCLLHVENKNWRHLTTQKIGEGNQKHQADKQTTGSGQRKVDKQPTYITENTRLPSSGNQRRRNCFTLCPSVVAVHTCFFCSSRIGLLYTRCPSITCRLFFFSKLAIRNID